MPTSVRTLWTAALVLSMGCQGVPSTSTTPPADARVQFSPTRWSQNALVRRPGKTRPAPASSANSPEQEETGRAFWRLEGFGSSTDIADGDAETPSASPSSRDRSPRSPALADPLTPPPSAPSPIGADEPAVAVISPPAFLPQQAVDQGSRSGEIDLLANHPSAESHAQASQHIGDVERAFAPRDGSLLEDVRNRFSRRSRRSQAASRHASTPESPFYEHSPAAVDDSESAPSPVVTMGVEADSQSPRDEYGPVGVPLEAPAPLSSVTRQTVLVEKLGELPDQDAEPTPRAPTDESESTEEGEVGFVSSLFEKNAFFDKFGIGPDRTRNRKANADIVLRQSQLAELKSPLAAENLADPPASDEATLTPLQTVQWQEEYDRLTTLLETQLASQTPGDSPLEQDYYIRQHVALRLLYLIGSRRAEALQAIPNCDHSQQEFWTAMMWALSNIFDEEAMPDRSHRAREAATQLRVALEHISPLAGLKLTKCQFCRQIDGFGSYETFERDEFAPGQSVLIYTEIENFLSEVTPQGEYLTVLQSTITIHEHGPNSRVVFHEHLPPTQDRCRSRRSDYYHNYRIRLPHDLTPGPHVLTLTVRDQLSHKQDTVSLNFLVRSGPAK